VVFQAHTKYSFPSTPRNRIIFEAIVLRSSPTFFKIHSYGKIIFGLPDLTEVMVAANDNLENHFVKLKSHFYLIIKIKKSTHQQLKEPSSKILN
jgi:hypothetical protein